MNPTIITTPTPSASVPALPSINWSAVSIPKPSLPPPNIPSNLSTPTPSAPGQPETPSVPAISSMPTPKTYSSNLSLSPPDISVVQQMVKTTLKSMIPSMISAARIAKGLPIIG